MSATRSREVPGYRRVVAVGFVALLWFTVSACSGGFGSTGDDFEPTRPGVLTVAAANLPAPGFWEPAGDGRFVGFEAGVADELADRLGLDEVRVVEASFADLVAGDLGDADIGISQLTSTPEREKHADFSTPYVQATPGVIARKGTKANDLAELQDLRWTMTKPSTLVAVLEDRIRPKAAPELAENRAAALDLLRHDEADCYLLDLPVALGLARSEPEVFEVVGQLSGDEGLSVVLRNNSPNLNAVDSAVRAMRADGTVGDLARTWLGSDGGEIPLIRVAD